jgi:RimJ/RimL family protein N-acetyltransferase
VAVELLGQVVLRDFRSSDRDNFIGLGSDEPMFEFMKFRLDAEFAARSFDYLISEPDLVPRRTWNLAIETLSRDFAGWAAVGGLTEGGQAEIGWYLGSSHWGFGYATEATRLLIDFARTTLDLRGLTATADPANGASRRVLEKCGFSSEVVATDADTWRGKRPRVLYSLDLRRA